LKCFISIEDSALPTCNNVESMCVFIAMAHVCL
jgi:hypothetical protein